MKRFLYGLATGTLLTLAVCGAWYYHRPTPTATKFVEVGRTKPKRILVPPMVQIRYLYRRTTDTVVVRVPLPRGFILRGAIGPSPIAIRRRHATLRYWSPDSLRYIEDRYVLPLPRWGIWIDAAVGYDRAAWAGADANVRSGHWVAYVGSAFYADGSRGLRFGVRRRLLGIR